MMWMWQRVMWGQSRRPENLGLADLGRREMTILVAIILLILWIGLSPNSLLRKMDASVTQLLGQMDGAPRADLSLPLRGSTIQSGDSAYAVFGPEPSASYPGVPLTRNPKP